MTRNDNGRFTVRWTALVRPLLGLAAILVLPALAACTTAEGTNALVDPGTFEREVMNSTLQGLDIVPQDAAKPDPTRRAPLVMPKQVAQLPPPTPGSGAATALPTDSDNPQISTAGLSAADLQRLRNARVVDLRSLDGRPLTDEERKQLTARMAAATKVATDSSRPLTLPPTSYFSSYKGKDTICRAKDGTLVALNDARCPAEIRNAMHKEGPAGSSVYNDIESDLNSMRQGDPSLQ